jgi:hypothetical protein
LTLLLGRLQDLASAMEGSGTTGDGVAAWLRTCVQTLQDGVVDRFGYTLVTTTVKRRGGCP